MTTLYILGISNFTLIETSNCSMSCGDGVRKKTTYQCGALSKFFLGCRITNVDSQPCKGNSECQGKWNILHYNYQFIIINLLKVLEANAIS